MRLRRGRVLAWVARAADPADEAPAEVGAEARKILVSRVVNGNSDTFTGMDNLYRNCVESAWSTYYLKLGPVLSLAEQEVAEAERDAALKDCRDAHSTDSEEAR